MDPTDAIDLDGFDTWLDQLALGIASPAPADAAELGQAAAWLQEKGQHIMASPSFERRLLAQLLPVPAVGHGSSEVPTKVFPALPRTSAQPLLNHRHRALMVATALLIAIPMMVVAIGSLGDGSNESTIPAPSNGLAQSGTPVSCSVEQPSTLTISGTPEHEAILIPNTNRPYPNVPGAGGPVLYEEDLPTGHPIDSDELPGIQRMLTTFAACLYAKDYASVDALFSDDSFRRAGVNRMAEIQGTPAPTADGLGTPVDPLRNLTAPVHPVIISHNVLPDGRVGVLLEQDLQGYGLEQYFILVKSDRGWLVDEVVNVTSEPHPSPEASSLTMVIEAIDLQFIPSNVQIPADVDVTLVVTNTGKARKTFVVSELDINQELPAGETISVVVNAPKGVYEFYSDVPGQQAAGMKGWLVVIPES